MDDLLKLVRDFAAARDWEQFHNPKNLVMAVAGEVGELSEVFQWLTPDQAAQIMAEPEKAKMVRQELADVAIYVLRLSDVLGIDLPAAIREKVALNEAKYPVAEARGSAAKYSDRGGGR